MKAIVRYNYGGPEVLKIEEVEKPIPGEKEILVKVISSAVTTADTMLRAGTPKFARVFLGMKRPKSKLIGTGFSGVVEAKGTAVENMEIGDEVFGETGINFGANAAYVCMSVDGVVLRKPASLSFEQAALMCDGPLTSMNFLRNLTTIQLGDRVLINGASGSLGTAAVQLAKHFGAHVTGVCSARNHELVKSLGADKVIDYAKQDFTEEGSYDVIYDTLGYSSFSKCKRVLSNRGKYLSPVLSGRLLLRKLFNFLTKKKALFSATGMKPAPELKELLIELCLLCNQQKLTVVMDKTYPMEEIVAAHEYVESGRKRGNIALTIVPSK